MNQKDQPHLPKYIIIMLDKDILEGMITCLEEFLKQILKKSLKWLITQINRMLKAQHEDLKAKKVGSVATDHMQVIWMKMFPRPISANGNLVKILKLRRKFNETLEELLTDEENMHILSITNLTESNYFSYSGDLTAKGMKVFWMEVNHQMKRFNYHEIDLTPVKYTSSAVNPKHHQHHKKHDDHFMLHPAQIANRHCDRNLRNSAGDHRKRGNDYEHDRR